ncbi:anomalous homeobox protein-like isoform X3 [Tamandua tetradactyla]|uniref:anomalous homeobox protein-like isoform X3 n=1 Tax=Tamandua tetradactyla TaxID=48850 RepID=UPI004053DF20
MQNFLALLRESRDACPTTVELVALTGRLCWNLKNDLAQAEPLVDALLKSQLCLYLLDNEDVVLVCAHMLAQREQPQAPSTLRPLPRGSEEPGLPMKGLPEAAGFRLGCGHQPQQGPKSLQLVFQLLAVPRIPPPELGASPMRTIRRSPR